MNKAAVYNDCLEHSSCAVCGFCIDCNFCKKFGCNLEARLNRNVLTHE